MVEKSPETLFAELLKGPFGVMAVNSFLEAVKQEMIDELTVPIEATMRMDYVSVGILNRVIDPEAVRMEDWFAVRSGAAD